MKLKLDREKLKYNFIILCLIGISIIGILNFSKSFAIYVAEGDSNISVDLAFSLLNVEELESEIKFDDLEPNSDREYNFSVSNFKDDKLIDVNLGYDVVITCTTNLPIEYELLDNNGNKINTTSEYVTDSDGTIFYVIKASNYKMNFKDKKTDYFKLKYKFGQQYDSNIYQDVIELISVKIDAKQE